MRAPDTHSPPLAQMHQSGNPHHWHRGVRVETPTTGAEASEWKPPPLAQRHQSGTPHHWHRGIRVAPRTALAGRHGRPPHRQHTHNRHRTGKNQPAQHTTHSTRARPPPNCFRGAGHRDRVSDVQVLRPNPKAAATAATALAAASPWRVRTHSPTEALFVGLYTRPLTFTRTDRKSVV